MSDSYSDDRGGFSSEEECRLVGQDVLEYRKRKDFEMLQTPKNAREEVLQKNYWTLRKQKEDYRRAQNAPSESLILSGREVPFDELNPWQSAIAYGASQSLKVVKKHLEDLQIAFGPGIFGDMFAPLHSGLARFPQYSQRNFRGRIPTRTQIYSPGTPRDLNRQPLPSSARRPAMTALPKSIMKPFTLQPLSVRGYNDEANAESSATKPNEIATQLPMHPRGEKRKGPSQGGRSGTDNVTRPRPRNAPSDPSTSTAEKKRSRPDPETSERATRRRAIVPVRSVSAPQLQSSSEHPTRGPANASRKARKTVLPPNANSDSPRASSPAPDSADEADIPIGHAAPTFSDREVRVAEIRPNKDLVNYFEHLAGEQVVMIRGRRLPFLTRNLQKGFEAKVSRNRAAKGQSVGDNGSTPNIRRMYSFRDAMSEEENISTSRRERSAYVSLEQIELGGLASHSPSMRVPYRCKCETILEFVGPGPARKMTSIGFYDIEVPPHQTSLTFFSPAIPFQSLPFALGSQRALASSFRVNVPLGASVNIVIEFSEFEGVHGAPTRWGTGEGSSLVRATCEIMARDGRFAKPGTRHLKLSFLSDDGKRPIAQPLISVRAEFGWVFRGIAAIRSLGLKLKSTLAQHLAEIPTVTVQYNLGQWMPFTATQVGWGCPACCIFGRLANPKLLEEHFQTYHPELKCIISDGSRTITVRLAGQDEPSLVEEISYPVAIQTALSLPRSVDSSTRVAFPILVQPMATDMDDADENQQVSFKFIQELPPVKPLGCMSWILLSAEEAIEEFLDIAEDDKLIAALWLRWILVHRALFYKNYLLAITQFLEDNRQLIRKDISFNAFRAWLLMMAYARYLNGKQVVDLLKMYNEMIPPGAQG